MRRAEYFVGRMFMKLAVTGKGGVGKTTVCALLAVAFVRKGHEVLAIDADPNPTLASSLGFLNPNNIVPLSEMKELIKERTGADLGVPGGMFRLNPQVDDIPERFSVVHNGIRLLRMGDVKRGGSGCYCAESVFLKNLVSHLILSDESLLIMDMEAGVEHLGRGTAMGVDWLLIVVEPSRQSLQTAKRIQELATDIGLIRLGVVVNKSRSDEETEHVTKTLAPIPVLGVLPYSDELRRSEMEGRPPDTSVPEIAGPIEEILNRIQAKTN